MVFGFDLGFNSKKSSSKAQYDKTGTTDVLTPDWWDPQLGQFNEAYAPSAVNATGMQNSALGNISGSAANPYSTDFLSKNVNPALQGIAMRMYDNGQNYDWQLQGSSPTVSASTAYENAQPYRDAYGTGVLDTALADYDTGVSRSANAFRAANIGGGGQAGGSAPVAAGVMAADAARGRGALSAQIRSDILDKSFGFGGGDASNRLSADQMTASIQNARDMANLQAKMNEDQARQNIDKDIASLVQQQGTNALTADGAWMEKQLAALQASGIPLDRALSILQAAVPGFGQKTDESGTETQSGKSSGFSFGLSGGGGK